MSKLVRYYSGEWSALYEDGVLVKRGDHYLVDEWISTHFGIEEHHNDDFLSEDGRSVFTTLSDVQAKQRDRESRETEAEETRRQAVALQAQAAELFEKANELMGKNR